MKKFLGILIVLLILLVAGGLWLYSSLDDQSTTEVASVTDDFARLKGPDSADAGRPRQGVYEYTVIGHERITRTGIDIDRDLPTSAVALVYNLDDGQYEVRTNFSDQHIEVARYDKKAEGTFLTFAKTTLKLGPIEVVKDRAWTPELLRDPADPIPGTTTSGTYQAGDTLTMRVTTTVLKPQVVNVGGTRVPATVVRFDQIASGEYTGDRTETFWWADDGMLLRYRIDSRLKGSTNLDFIADQRLISLEPTVG